MAGAALVIAATDRPELNALVARHARSAGIPVNVADDPGGSTFFFPAVVRRGEFVTGISTAGLCPRFAARFREGLDAVLPEELGVWVEALGQERRCVSGVERIGRLDSIIDPLLRQIFVM
jgi:siroheme synthase-like protein